MDDASLVQTVLDGRINAYGELIGRYAARVTALCHARIGRPDLAEELAQESLVRAYEQLATLADPARFGPWLAGIAANVCRDWLKTRQNAQVPFSALGANGLPAAAHPTVPAADGATEHADEVRRLLAAVATLPEECRTVLLLFYYDDLSYRNIADLLEVSPATVNGRLTRSRALLRARLAGGPPGSEPAAKLVAPSSQQG